MSYIYFCTTLHSCIIGRTVKHSSPPSSAEPMYEEVGVAGKVKSSKEIQLIFNEAHGPVVKGSIQTSANFAYGRINCETV